MCVCIDVTAYVHIYIYIYIYTHTYISICSATQAHTRHAALRREAVGGPRAEIHS